LMLVIYDGKWFFIFISRRLKKKYGFLKHFM